MHLFDLAVGFQGTSAIVASAIPHAVGAAFTSRYRVTPHSFEFWQGRLNRLHDRFKCTLQPDGSWSIARLMP